MEVFKEMLLSATCVPRGAKTPIFEEDSVEKGWLTDLISPGTHSQTNTIVPKNEDDEANFTLSIYLIGK